MPHQCVHCGKIYPNASREILEGCSCGAHFFLYIRPERLEQMQSARTEESIEIINLGEKEKNQIEKDIREIVEMPQDEEPVVLDIESIRVIKPGHFEIDVGKVFRKEKPFVIKLSEGKYIIDLTSSIDSILDEKGKREIFKGTNDEEKVAVKRKGRKKKDKNVNEIIVVGENRKENSSE